MARFPIGAAVRDNYGKVGRVVRVPAALRLRGYAPILFDGLDQAVLVRGSTLVLVARRYGEWLAWERARAAGDVSNKWGDR